MSIEIRPLTPTIGAEIEGVDLSGPIPDEVFGTIYDAWLEHTILLFRGQRLSPAQQVAATRRFGELEHHTLPQYTLPEQPEVFVISNIEEGGKPVGAQRSGRHWHSDSQFLEEPSKGSLLYALEVPDEGGETLFANMYAAYDTLPADIRERIDGARILVSRAKAWPISYPDRPPLTDEQKAKLPDVLQPLVRTHPETGRRSLVIGGNVVWEIVGMPFEEGRALLDELHAHATRPDLTYAHFWRPGDAGLWDNRCTLHSATPFDEQRYRRLMHRTTIAGDRPH